MEPQNLTNDHDILTTLVANVGNMKESQDKFHREMKESMTELKNNWQGKINKNTDDIDSLAKDKADKVALANLEAIVLKLQLSVSKFWITITLYSILVGGMIGLMIYHIVNSVK
jgi:uncharacterized membrane protein